MISAQSGLKQVISRRLHQSEAAGNEPPVTPEFISLQPLYGDGSSRRFFRVFIHGTPRCIAVLPATTGARDMAESRAAAAIARHLHRASVPVAQLLGEDEGRGLLLFEDLGDVRLHDILQRDRDEGIGWYPEVIRSLVRMQVIGAQGFDTGWCCDTPLYDRSVMVERESGYFLKAFWEQMLFGEPVEGILEECADLAEQACLHFDTLFLHRDFQCRNLMITAGRIRVIDFQGGRLGPPGYDIASLLIDPYAGLSDARQEQLLLLYLEKMSAYQEVDIDRLKASYPYLAVQRNLQIVGAFAYLSAKKHKTFFRPYIIPSLVMLQNRLEDRRFQSYVMLRRTVSEAIRLIRERLR